MIVALFEQLSTTQLGLGSLVLAGSVVLMTKLAQNWMIDPPEGPEDLAQDREAEILGDPASRGPVAPPRAHRLQPVTRTAGDALPDALANPATPQTSTTEAEAVAATAALAAVPVAMPAGETLRAPIKLTKVTSAPDAAVAVARGSDAVQDPPVLADDERKLASIKPATTWRDSDGKPFDPYAPIPVEGSEAALASSSGGAAPVGSLVGAVTAKADAVEGEPGASEAAPLALVAAPPASLIEIVSSKSEAAKEDLKAPTPAAGLTSLPGSVTEAGGLEAPVSLSAEMPELKAAQSAPESAAIADAPDKPHASIDLPPLAVTIAPIVEAVGKPGEQPPVVAAPAKPPRRMFAGLTMKSDKSSEPLVPKADPIKPTSATPPETTLTPEPPVAVNAAPTAPRRLFANPFSKPLIAPLNISAIPIKVDESTPAEAQVESLAPAAPAAGLEPAAPPAPNESAPAPDSEESDDVKKARTSRSPKTGPKETDLILIPPAAKPTEAKTAELVSSAIDTSDRPEPSAAKTGPPAGALTASVAPAAPASAVPEPAKGAIASVPPATRLVGRPRIFLPKAVAESPAKSVETPAAAGLASESTSASAAEEEKPAESIFPTLALTAATLAAEVPEAAKVPEAVTDTQVTGTQPSTEPVANAEPAVDAPAAVEPMSEQPAPEIAATVEAKVEPIEIKLPAVEAEVDPVSETPMGGEAKTDTVEAKAQAAKESATAVDPQPETVAEKSAPVEAKAVPATETPAPVEGKSEAAAIVDTKTESKPEADKPVEAAAAVLISPVNEPRAELPEPVEKMAETSVPTASLVEMTPEQAPAPIPSLSVTMPAPELSVTTPKPAMSSTETTTTVPPTGRASAQLTLAFEVTSLQLTPFFKLGAVQLRPLSNVVGLHLIGAQPENPLAAGISFEIEQVELDGAHFKSILLKPLGSSQAAATPTPKLQVDAVQLTQPGEAGPIQITPSGGTSTAVHLLGTFTIAAMDFTPSFEIGSLRLEPNSNSVLLRLAPSQRPTAIDLPPAFDVATVQVEDGQISSVRLIPTGGK